MLENITHSFSLFLMIGKIYTNIKYPSNLSEKAGIIRE